MAREKVKNQVGNKITNQGIPGEYAFTNDFMQRYNETGGGFFKIPEDQVTLSEGGNPVGGGARAEPRLGRWHQLGQGRPAV